MNEVELDRAAREVIEAGRDGVAPNEFVAERIRHAVNRTLRGSAPPARRGMRPVAILVAFGAAALAGGLYAAELVRKSEEPQPTEKPVPATPAPQAPRVAAPAPTTEAPAVESKPPAEIPKNPTAERPTAAPSARSQKLAAEIDQLARVNAAVNAGQGARALELLAEYDREFRPAILGQERAAAHVLALCAAGRTSEAKAAAKRFHAKWQRSPLSDRVSKSCAAGE